MDDAANIAVAMQYLRRKYTTAGVAAAADLVRLRQLADTVVENGAFDAVTITGQGFEGGQANGQLVFPPMAYLAAIESLLLELDPTNTPAPPSRVVFADFSSSATES